MSPSVCGAHGRTAPHGLNFLRAYASVPRDPVDLLEPGFPPPLHLAATSYRRVLATFKDDRGVQFGQATEEGMETIEMNCSVPPRYSSCK